MAKIILTSTQSFKEAAKYAKESSKISAFLDNHFFTIGEAIVAGLSGVTAFQFAPMAVKAIGEHYEQKDAADIQKIIDKLIDVQKIIPPAGIFMDENNKAIGELRSFQKKNESLAQDSGLSL